MSDSQHASHISQDPKDDKGSEQDKLDFSEDEESLVARMHNLVGDRWALIAGRIPGRTAEEIEKYWRLKHNTSNERQS